MPGPNPTIYAVARHAGVSIATVSRVQRGLEPVALSTRRRVQAAIEELGYRPSSPARALAGQRHGAAGIVFPDLSGPYYSEVIHGFEEEVAARGESLLIVGTHGRDKSEELVLDLAGRVDGLLIMGRTVPDRLVEDLEADGMPLVLLGRPPVGRTPAVRAENVESAIEMTAHLLDAHGHRRLAFVGDPDLSPDASERWRGFVEAHRQRGLRPPERAVKSAFREVEGFAAASAALERTDRPTGLVCANDEIALGACGAAKNRGLSVPQDVAVTGWDDIPLARYLFPPLTTVRQPMHELGARSARLLFERIDERPSAPESVVLPTRLAVRASCGCKQEHSEAEPREVEVE